MGKGKGQELKDRSLESWVEEVRATVEEERLVDYSEEQLRRAFSEIGLSSQEVDRAIAYYLRYREMELNNIIEPHGGMLNSLLLDIEGLADETMKFKGGDLIVEDILRQYLGYLNYKKRIAETYQESKSWGVVFSTCVYSNEPLAQEGFIDYVEEICKTKVKDAKHLQKLTGITHLDSWDNKAGKHVTPDTEEGAKENAIRELEETIIGSRYSKYFRTLEDAIQSGAKYKDLLRLKPESFGLPQSWRGHLGSDQYSSILWALSFAFLVNESAFLRISPDLRSIAEEVEAPYSVLMDCYNLTNKRKPYGATGN